MASTGNAGGSHNLVLAHGGDDLAGLCQRMGRGLLVTEQLGHGVNPVTGDYSRGLRARPSSRYSIRGRNHHRRQPHISTNTSSPSATTLVQGARQCGSVLIENMMVVGSIGAPTSLSALPTNDTLSFPCNSEDAQATTLSTPLSR
jgi:PmbA protein